ncbi:hypothetical protein [Legionella jordanis]|uniref:Glycosyltransferase RgtA/B/C/D-like domain-containing protein n=1 Tax=Legionella jordanis TaxID=456 RepID=A0A0W0VAB9_9GAMM|nr:hypothetical protein [Legionella jordanis]KTD17048.1 hypothetical protein Ljor_1354 [Legionella jordanis]RMX03184.1 hypothetical protein EAW55_07065 [Legionella jordanis]VEH12755.1 Uncharacterised protein [Legionella jordanis]
MNPSSTKTVYFLIPSLLLLTLIILEFQLILSMNGGVFSYSLDDPYIHLSLAKHIARGWYGLSFLEHASPSSSILWPFLLAPLSYFPFFDIAPFILNSFLCFCILWILIDFYLSIQKSIVFSWGYLIVFCLLIPGFNFIGLIFSGMEHALQMLLAVLLVIGLINESKSHRTSRWLILAIFLGPLVRYESLALSLPALIFLYYRGHRKTALYTLAILLLALGLFSLFLYSMNQPLLPTSTLVKLSYGFHWGFAQKLMMGIHVNFIQRQALIFLFLLTCFLVLILYSDTSTVKKQLLMVLSASLLLHLLFGRFNWYYRYEMHLYAAAWVLIFYLFFDRVPEESAGKRKGFFFLLVLGFVFASLPYFTVPITTPIGANNIYIQQYQMRKFVLQNLKGPVAANDIGWLSFDNPYYVLDLWGLANYRAYQERVADIYSTNWMDLETRQAGIKLAMLYNSWFYSAPENWQLLGCLYFKGPLITADDRVVHFYATDHKYASELLDKLGQYQKELPNGAGFVFDCSSVETKKRKQS